MTRQTRVLITGFGRFPGAPANPSGALAKALARRRRPALAGMALTAEVLPTTWAAADGFADALRREDPDIVLMIGLAARRRQVCVETPRGEPRRRLSRCDAAAARRAAARCVGPGRDRRSRARRRAWCGRCGSPAFPPAPRAMPAAISATRRPMAPTARRATTGRPRLAVFVHIPRPNHGRLAMPALLRALEALLVALSGQLRGDLPDPDYVTTSS